MITYRQAVIQDKATIANLGLLLYGSDNTFSELLAEAEVNLQSGKWATFLAFDNEKPVGMCEISLRTDYVEGISGGLIGYIEGIYVSPEYRNQYIAASLVKHGEKWAQERGCSEFASDCKLDNEVLLGFSVSIRNANNFDAISTSFISHTENNIGISIS